MKIAGFDQGTPFYDNKTCPMGFSRSGHFTLQQATLIERYGNQLLALEDGKETPLTPEQAQFVDVCAGKKPPSTLLEKAWARYYTLRFDTCAVNPFGKAKVTIDEDDIDTSDDDDL
ncbi:Uncharacterised protein [BD1-7 clade bacterium]|uniref:Macrodomain Ori protein n=1 Tax=BD1-7 clade bacterium TaxID=2029982 RepID=A0A5S9QEV7_9GAMM|nr:Uncharacterised protein [BD1-7 clade bacterium]CAA0116984.1 Uncharacterised protein [BD1-7 clade bacterium]